MFVFGPFMCANSGANVMASCAPRFSVFKTKFILLFKNLIKKFTIVFTRAFNCVSKIRFSVTEAPTGADIILEVSKNGTSIFAGTNYPTIDAGTNTTNVSASSQFISGGYVDFAVGDELKVGITQVGAATSAGTGLKASMVYNNCPCF